MNPKWLVFSGLLLLALLAPLASRTAPPENRASISGKITDRATSAPLAAEIGLAIRTNKGIVLKHTRANELGEFAFADLPAGEFHLSTKHDEYAVEHAALSLQPDESRALDLRLIKTRSLHGVVTDERQNPLAEARVQVFYEQEAGFANTYQWEEGDVRTDGRGRFTIEVHPERAFVVQASRQGFLSEAALPLPNDALTLRLTRGVAVTGVISDELGNPLVDAQVQLIAEPEQTLRSRFLPFEVLQQTQQTAVTQADGTFRFEQARPADGVLVVRHPQTEPQRLTVNLTRKNHFLVTLHRTFLPERKDRRQR